MAAPAKKDGAGLPVAILATVRAKGQAGASAGAANLPRPRPFAAHGGPWLLCGRTRGGRVLSPWVGERTSCITHSPESQLHSAVAPPPPPGDRTRPPRVQPLAR